MEFDVVNPVFLFHWFKPMNSLYVVCCTKRCVEIDCRSVQCVPQQMQTKYYGMPDVECVTYVNNIGMVGKIRLSILK